MEETCQKFNLEKARRFKVRELLKDFLGGLDENLKYFCRMVRQDLRDEKDYVIAITGYPGLGKSQLATIIGILIDFDYIFDDICFIPTSKEIENTYMKLKMYSVLHVDEASRGLHKQRWFDKVQQTLNTLYDTEREGHFLCTLLIMPRFQNFSENFRNFRIKYWINIVDRGLAIAYKRDEDKDAKDPWHLDENYKLKQKRWKNKKIYERDIPDSVRMEQSTLNYWFYFNIPEIPKDVWEIYQELKKESRTSAKQKEADMQIESYRDKCNRERRERWEQIVKLKGEGYTHEEIGVKLGTGAETIRRNIRALEAYNAMNSKEGISPQTPCIKSNIIYNLIETDKSNEGKV